MKITKLLAVLMVVAFSGCSDIKDYWNEKIMDEPKVEDAVPESGPRLLEMKFEDNGKFLTWKVEGIEGWKNQSPDNVNAWIVINGVECENIREGYSRQHIDNAYGSGGHGVRGLKNGQPCEIRLRKFKSSEQTNPKTVIWKGRST